MMAIKLIGVFIVFLSVLELSYLILITEREKVKLEYKLNIFKAIIVLAIQTYSNLSLVNIILITYQVYILYKYLDDLFNIVIFKGYENLEILIKKIK